MFAYPSLIGLLVLIRKKKRYAWMPENRFLLALMQSSAGILAINWIFQGMLGMQRKELVFRLLLEALLAFLLFCLLVGCYPVFIATVLSIAIAHTINWLFNTHLWVCMRYTPFYRRSPKAIERYLAGLEAGLSRRVWLREAVIIGSLGGSPGVQSDKSDIDLRIIFPKGLCAWVKTNVLLMGLRTKALFTMIPLDLYAYDEVSALDRFRQDEGLTIILDRDKRVFERYANRLSAGDNS